MTSAPAAIKPRVLVDTEQAQAAASDPNASVWVGANAGAGKTHVLKMRVLRLLLSNTRPERILCLTYTKAAAAEMSARIFSELAQWATVPGLELSTKLSELVGRRPTAAEQALARQLFARAIETPGGLKIDTIHAFCERLLQRFPLEAGVPPSFQIVDDALAAEMTREAIDAVLTTATRDPTSALGRSLQSLVVRVQGDEFEQLIEDAIAKRAWLAGISRLGLRGGDPIDAARSIYLRGLGLTSTASVEQIKNEMTGLLSAGLMADAIRVLSASGKRDQEAASRFAAVRTAATPAQEIEALTAVFLTKERQARADQQFIAKAVRVAEPGIADALVRARDRMAILAAELDLVGAVDATMALVRIADAVRQGYAEAKSRRAALDFDDLIERTAGLFSNPQQASWVLFKLDGGLDHILVDEAQDTSPVQWSVVEALAQAFFAAGAARDVQRTVFAVGDEKQSIYSFQGAAPKMFAEVGGRFSAMAAEVGLPWRRIPLELSFRSVEPILGAVDAVFADAARMPGLTSTSSAVRHIALRAGHAGTIEIWPVEAPADLDAVDVFNPLAERTSIPPVRRVAARIADRIKHMIDSGEPLLSEGRPIRPGDIIILVRSRRPLAATMVAELKHRGVPVAGADRMILGQQIAVQDLLAVARVLLLPEDDLSVAIVLKSPLFDLTDDDLITIAPKRKGSLYSAVLEAGRANPRFSRAAEQLKRWRGRADYLPPYEFFARMLDEDGMRAKLLARLGVEAAEALDEFLSLALGYDDAAPPSLQAFVATFDRAEHEIKRDMEHGRDEVRVMTVHAAKGLEAPIVFLPDTCTSAGGRSGRRLVPLPELSAPSGLAEAYLWATKGAGRLSAVAAARAEVETAETEERNRLLYVAMTRARDRLYIAGFEGSRPRRPDCWYDRIVEALEPQLQNGFDQKGRPVRSITTPQAAAIQRQKSSQIAEVEAETRPAWMTRRAVSEQRTSIPLAPSRLAPMEIDDEGEPKDHRASAGDAGSARAERPQPPSLAADPPVPSPRQLAGEHRFLRGVVTHALLEHLPGLPASSWAVAAAGFVDARARGLSQSLRRSIVDEALAVLRHPEFAPVFGPASLAEVPIVADLARPGHPNAPKLKIAGQIDRLVHLDHEVLIVDYKTNRPPPTDIEDVPLPYIVQLCAYRFAIKQIFPKFRIRAAILWTDGARLAPIADVVLDAREADLWDLAATRLDVAELGS